MSSTNHIKITNISETMLTNVTLCLDTLAPSLSKIMVVRERGSLSFGPGTSQLCLGNLYPDETAYLYYTLGMDSPSSPALSFTNQNMQVMFAPEGKEMITNNPKTFLHFEHFDYVDQ